MSKCVPPPPPHFLAWKPSQDSHEEVVVAATFQDLCNFFFECLLFPCVPTAQCPCSKQCCGAATFWEFGSSQIRDGFRRLRRQTLEFFILGSEKDN